MIEPRKVKDNTFSEYEIKLFLNFIKKYRGVDLSFYKDKFIYRRLKARFGAIGVHTLGEYASLLRKNDQEWNNFLDNLSINVSKFFRDPEVFFQFQKVCVPELIEKKKEAKSIFIRCWSCGCSCGEEPYSLAIIFKEFLKQQQRFIVKVFATDVDEDALDKAKKGEYKKASLKNVESKILEKYFVHINNDTWRVNDEVKSMVSFRKHNLLIDKPLKFMDVIFFRNVRIYFDDSKVEKIYFNISSALKKGGYLVLGKVEILPSFLRGAFEPISLINKIFKKK
jgi:chemotaxis protein methyltransferase CheR